jgi:hypothetical protein
MQGRDGWNHLLAERKAVFGLLRDGLSDIAARHGERVLDTRPNSVCVGCVYICMWGVCADAVRRRSRWQ